MEDQYQALYTTFRWWVPQRLNIADVCCRRWTAASADARRIALYAEDAQGRREIWTFGRLQEYANRLSNGLRRMGVQRGDRVAIALPQRPETLVAHLAAYQLGAITVPLSVRLNAPTYEQRLRDSEARIAIVDAAAASALLPAAEHCPLLRQTVGVDLDDERVLSWRTLLARQESAFDMQVASASDPALLLYTAGTGSAPKGVVLPHATIMGNLPGFVCAQNWFPQPADVLWTASEWGCPHGLFSTVLPALYFGQPLVGVRQDLAPEAAFELLQRYRVTNLALTTRDLRRLLKAVPHPARRYQLGVRAVATTDTALGSALFEQCKAGFGVEPNETFSLVETGTIIGQSAGKWAPRPGSMGRPYPGHQVALLDPSGRPVEPGQNGEIAVNRYDIHGYADPAFFAGYWRGEETGRPVSGTWHRTGDLARQDEDGYFWYIGRIDEMFKLGDRLVAPGPIEDTLRQHAGVAEVVVVPTMDAAGIKAYVVPEWPQETPTAEPAPATENGAPATGQARPGQAPAATRSPMDKAERAAALNQELLAHAARHLAAPLVPREIEFVDALPLTPSGKVLRHALRQIEDDRVRKWPPVPATATQLP